MEKEDTKVLKAVRALITTLPLLLRLGLIVLKYKRLAKKREKVFKKTLRKEGLNDDVVENLVEDLPELKLRDLLSGKSRSFNLLK